MECNMTDTTYETKTSRLAEDAINDAYDDVDKSLRTGEMSVADELLNYPKLADAFNALMSDHYRRILSPEALAARLSTILCDLVTEEAEWKAGIP
jgi:hypothetical protein